MIDWHKQGLIGHTCPATTSGRVGLTPLSEPWKNGC
jgi:hypothetical protein